MSNPSFENIDQWFFEYTEGNLTSAQESRFLDFVSEHPELIQELKAWKKARITPLTSYEPDTASLIKPASPLLRPVLLASIAVIAFLLGWVGISYFPVQKQYTQSTIDAKIIHLRNEDSDTFIKNAIASYKHQQKVENSENTQQKSVFAPSQNKVLNQLDFNNSNKQKETVNQTTSNGAELRKIQQQFHAKSKDLDGIIAYLNRGIEPSKDIASEEKITTSKASSSSSSFKSSLNQIMRKIRRMVNQPTALRNTKNPHYHAPMMTGFKPVPAMAGTATGNRIQATSRIQWLNQPNAQLLNTLSWDSYLYSLRGGLGVDLNYDGYNINSLSNYSIGLTYSPKFSISKNFSFEPSFRFKMGVIDIDKSPSLIGSNIEMNRNNITPLFVNENKLEANQMWYKDFGVGFMINTKWFYAGFNADNLGRHNNNFYSSNLQKEYRDDIHYTAIIGTEYEAITRDMSVSAYGLFQNYGDLKELWLGGNFQYHWVQIGAGINTKADVGASIGLVFDQVNIHYNVDYTESKLLNNKYLSHQLSLGILIKPSRLTAKYLNL